MGTRYIIGLILVLASFGVDRFTRGQGVPDVLRQLDGFWTAEWVAAGGGSKLEQVLFSKNGLNRHTAALPFLPGLATITLCQGQGCAGADIDVSGTGFDCLYAYSVYGQNEFAWTSKGGQGACPPSAKFVRVVGVPVPSDAPPVAIPPANRPDSSSLQPDPSVLAPTVPANAPRGSYWSSGGSLFRLDADADKPARRIYFFEPSTDMSVSGAHSGDLVFSGRRTGNTYTGVAYAFVRKCGKYEYPVVGTVSDGDQTISLSGRKPTVDGSCRVVGHESAQFELRYQYRVN
jgi:hypothetical protein